MIPSCPICGRPLYAASAGPEQHSTPHPIRSNQAMRALPFIRDLPYVDKQAVICLLQGGR